MKLRIFVLISVFSLFISSCKTPESTVIKDTKPEKISRTFNGKARIVEIIPAKENGEKGNTSFFAVYFDFIPAGNISTSDYAYPDKSDKHRLLEYDNRDSFHNNWIAKWKIKTGNEYSAKRIESGGKKTGGHVFYQVELNPGK